MTDFIAGFAAQREEQLILFPGKRSQRVSS
jgi:hypothetical protein